MFVNSVLDELCTHTHEALPSHIPSLTCFDPNTHTHTHKFFDQCTLFTLTTPISTSHSHNTQSTHSVQGSHGMKYSLISQELIADCVEIMHEAYAAVSKYMVLPSVCCHGNINCVLTALSYFRMLSQHWEAVTRQVRWLISVVQNFSRVSFPKHLSINT